MREEGRKRKWRNTMDMKGKEKEKAEEDSQNEEKQNEAKKIKKVRRGGRDFKKVQ